MLHFKVKLTSLNVNIHPKPTIQRWLPQPRTVLQIHQLTPLLRTTHRRPTPLVLPPRNMHLYAALPQRAEPRIHRPHTRLTVNKAKIVPNLRRAGLKVVFSLEDTSRGDAVLWHVANLERDTRAERFRVAHGVRVGAESRDGNGLVIVAREAGPDFEDVDGVCAAVLEDDGVGGEGGDGQGDEEDDEGKEEEELRVHFYR